MEVNLVEELKKIELQQPNKLVNIGPKATRSFPETYRRNSKKEKIVLSYAENFRRQFVQIFGDRKPLLLTPKNECQIDKFISSYIRPTQLRFKELYDYDGAAEFVADYVTYELLENPTDLPQAMRSPTTVLYEQTGNCLEMSTLLCSFLIGNGYDAYCVSGYALREVCNMDEKRDVCPFLQKQQKEETVSVEQKVRKYAVKPPKDMKSKFIKMMDSRQETAKEEAIRKKKEDEEARIEELEKPGPDKLFGLRVHCWVLVLHGQREVAESFFIEPSTGRVRSLAFDGYLGVESIWNHKNYWVNMQDCADGVQSLVYDLGDAAKWEYIFPTVEKPTLRLPVDDMEASFAIDDEEENADYDKDILDMPPSWVEPLQLTIRDVQSRCPNGKKTILYKRAKLEKFADYLNPDGLVCRLTIATDSAMKNVVEVREWFKHRKDHLETRVSNKQTKQIVEKFAPGRSDGKHLKEHTYFEDNSGTRTMLFYDHARVDGLIRREETAVNMTEHYANRADFLYFFSTDFATLPQKRFRLAGEEPERPILKMTERYHRNSLKSASEDVAERVFNDVEERFQLTYHLDKEHITACTRDIAKPPVHCTAKEGTVIHLTSDMITSFKVDQGAPKDKDLEMYLLLTDLLKAEEDRQAYVRATEQEVRLILKTRRSEEEALERLTLSVYDTTRNDTAKRRREDVERKQREEEEARKEMQLDYLAPFLAQIGNPERLTRDDAKKVRDTCLKDLKERLVAMANLIQSRFEKETQELQRKQSWFQQNQTTLSKEEEEDYVSYCSEAMFRIQILEQRLDSHKRTAPEKYMNMEKKLREDPRLSELAA